jgi:hypothetical protein
MRSTEGRIGLAQIVRTLTDYAYPPGAKLALLPVASGAATADTS